MFERPARFRVFTHADGRAWHVRVRGVTLDIVIVTADGERLERTRTARDGNEADRERDAMIAEQTAEGFVEASTAEWRAQLDDLVGHWREDDPAFDAAALAAAVLALPDAQRVVETTARLGERWVAQKDGSRVLDFDTTEADAAEGWLRARLPAVLPMLLLALRYPDSSVQGRVDRLLGEARSPGATTAILSIFRHPAANLASHLGGRPQEFPSAAARNLDPATLVPLLGHADFRIAGEVARVLAEHAKLDAIYDALFAYEHRAKTEDVFANCLMRAAEVRRDPRARPYLEWMAKSRRFRSAGYRERIAEILASLPA